MIPLSAISAKLFRGLPADRAAEVWSRRRMGIRRFDLGADIVVAGDRMGGLCCIA